MNLKTLIIFSLIIFQFFYNSPVLARVTPEDKENEKRIEFNQKVKTYSPKNQEVLDKLSLKIKATNQIRSKELEDLMLKQGLILDEYQRRLGGDETEGIKKARYWVTFAHEAVAYQAAKVYIYNLTTEANIKSDAKNLVNLFQSELNSARTKVINSQKTLDQVIK